MKTNEKIAEVVCVDVWIQSQNLKLIDLIQIYIIELRRYPVEDMNSPTDVSRPISHQSTVHTKNVSLKLLNRKFHGTDTLNCSYPLQGTFF